MQDDTQRRQAANPLPRRYGFDDWRDTSRMDGDLFVTGLHFDGRELPEWTLDRHRELAAPRFPHAIRSMWRSATGEEGLLVEVYESDSRADAHQLLLDLLGEFQGPTLDRVEEIGDVAFATAGRLGVVFARGNLVVMTRNATGAVRPVDEVATRLDGRIIERPETAGAERPVIRAFRRGAPVAREAVALETDVEQPDEGKAWLKLFADDGRLFREEGRLLWSGPGPTRVTLFAVAGAMATARSLDIE